jgi:hypothetical protein
LCDAYRRCSSGGGTSTGLPDGRRGLETHFIGVGALKLEVQFDPGTRGVRIQDQSISSDTANVILVDEVDGAAGPRIVGTINIDPASQADSSTSTPSCGVIRLCFRFFAAMRDFPISRNTRPSRSQCGGR